MRFEFLFLKYISMQPNHEDLVFLKQKIEEIKTALFRAETDSILQIPGIIISTLKADESGNIWFFTFCTGPYKEYLDKEFYVSLDYYKKEHNCKLLIKGKAVIEEDNKDFLVAANNLKGSANKIVLIRVKISKAEYAEIKTFSKISFGGKIRSAFNYIVDANHNKMYDFSS
jgi:hypothetical protein